MNYGIPNIANYGQVSQPKRRKLNRATGASKNRMKKGVHGHKGRWRQYTEKALAFLQKNRLDAKNKRRIANGLEPLDSYTQV